MNASLISLEIVVLVLGLAVLLMDLWMPAERKHLLGYGTAAALALVLVFSFFRIDTSEVAHAFGQSYVLDGLAIFFKRFFLLAAIIVVLMAVAFSDRIEAGLSEYYGLMVLALLGMMFAASANNFAMLFVSIELITVAFYVLTSFQRAQIRCLEAGVKYLILGALASAFTIYGIALVYGTSGTIEFRLLAERSPALLDNPLFLLGLLLVVLGLAFKIAAFPLQIWAPDVYQGAPAPTVAFLAVGSKAAGFVVLLRLLFGAVPEVTAQWSGLLIFIAAITILYGNLCAIPQRNLKRLFGYSSVAHAGYLLVGVAVMAANAGQRSDAASAILYYLAGYLFTVLAAFTVLCLAIRQADAEDISALAGLHRRSPLLAVAMTLSMVSLAGIPPLAGFFGKFLLFKAALEQGAANPAYYWLVAIAIVGVLISIYYYFGVVRAIYWSKEPADVSAIAVPRPFQAMLCVCIIGMLYLGILPNRMVKTADEAVAVFKVRPANQFADKARP